MGDWGKLLHGKGCEVLEALESPSLEVLRGREDVALGDRG